MFLFWNHSGRTRNEHYNPRRQRHCIVQEIFLNFAHTFATDKKPKKWLRQFVRGENSQLRALNTWNMKWENGKCSSKQRNKLKTQKTLQILQGAFPQIIKKVKNKGEKTLERWMDRGKVTHKIPCFFFLFDLHKTTSQLTAVNIPQGEILV